MISHKGNLMLKNILFFSIPTVLYFCIRLFIPNFNDVLLLTLLLSAVIFWAGAIIPEYQTALYFLFIASFFSLAPQEIVFSGFYSSAFWLVFAGMIITIVMKKVHINSYVLKVFNFFAIDTYLKILIAIALFNITLCFIIPSSLSRMFIIIPLLEVVCKNFGFQKSSKGYLGITITGILTTSLPGFVILPSNLPNMILAGLTDSIYNIQLLYSEYLIYNFFIFGILKSMIILAYIYFFYKEEPTSNNADHEQIIVQTKEKIIFFVILGIIALWMSDSLHGVKPSFIAIFGILILIHPALKAIDKNDLTSINFPTLIFVAALIALGNILSDNALIKEGLQTFITNHLNNLPKNSFLAYMLITLFPSFSGIFVIQPTIPSLFTPFASDIANLGYFSLKEVFMMQVASFSNIFLAHQSPPIIIALGLAGVSASKIFKPLVSIAILTIVLLYPLHYLWIEYLR